MAAVTCLHYRADEFTCLTPVKTHASLFTVPSLPRPHPPLLWSTSRPWSGLFALLGHPPPRFQTRVPGPYSRMSEKEIIRVSGVSYHPPESTTANLTCAFRELDRGVVHNS